MIWFLLLWVGAGISGWGLRRDLGRGEAWSGTPLGRVSREDFPALFWLSIASQVAMTAALALAPIVIVLVMALGR